MRETLKRCCARFCTLTHEQPSADSARTNPRSGGDQAGGLPQRDGRACGASEGAIAGGPVLARDLLFPRQAADRVKLVFWHGTGLCLFAKRLEDGKFPVADPSAVIPDQHNGEH